MATTPATATSDKVPIDQEEFVGGAWAQSFLYMGTGLSMPQVYQPVHDAKIYQPPNPVTSSCVESSQPTKSQVVRCRSRSFDEHDRNDSYTNKRKLTTEDNKTTWVTGGPRKRLAANLTNTQNDDEEEDDEDINRKKRPNLPGSATVILKNWMMSPEHFAHPYPTEQEKLRLAEETGIGLKQLTNWFVNARKRLWQPLLREKGASVKDYLSNGRSVVSNTSSPASSPALNPTPYPSFTGGGNQRSSMATNGSSSSGSVCGSGYPPALSLTPSAASSDRDGVVTSSRLASSSSSSSRKY